MLSWDFVPGGLALEASLTFTPIGVTMGRRASGNEDMAEQCIQHDCDPVHVYREKDT